MKLVRINLLVCYPKMNSRTYTSSLELQNRIPHTAPQSAESPVELAQLHASQIEVSRNVASVQQYLEPADRGPAAWRLLGAAFVFEALLWGKFFGINHRYCNLLVVSRVSAFVWSISELLLSSSPICQRSVYSHRRYRCLRNIVPWSTVCHPTDQT